MVTLADRIALDHSCFRESSPIVRGPSPIGSSRESLNVHRIFFMHIEKKKRTCRGIFAAVDSIFPVRSDPITRGNLTRRL